MAAFLPQEIIRRKRDRLPLSREAIARFVAGICDGTISEGQVAAFAMAVCFNGMSPPECVALTRAMTGSGIPWRGRTSIVPSWTSIPPVASATR